MRTMWLKSFAAAALLVLAGGTSAQAAAPNYGGMWWNSSESGWGINVAHQGNSIQADWFTYDTSGKAWWLILIANETGPGTFGGTIYQSTGSPYDAPFNSASVAFSPVGSATLSFASVTSGTFSYTVNGVSQIKNIVPQVFRVPVPTCVWNAQPNQALATNFQDVWGNPAEPGWEVHFTHQNDIIFAGLFVYDLDGRAMFFVMSNGARTSPNVYSGSLYRTSGPPFSASPWNSSLVSVTQVGTMTITFANGNSASLTYNIGATSVTKSITRRVFGPPGTVCGYVPASPASVTATSGHGQATVSFGTPSDGGLPITGYTVTANPGGATASGGASPLTVTGLINGTAYTFTVTATNAIGTSAPSAASNSVTPGAPQAVDFNRDGHPDILWSNTANGSTYVWYMGGTPPALISDAFVAQIDPSWKVQGIADFNGDAKSDLVWRNTANGDTYVWYMDGPAFVSDAFLFSLPTQWVIQGVADFNADAKPDFLMRNVDPSSGVAFVWFFDNATPIGDQYLFGIDPAWKVEQVGDMNGDAQPDLLFRHMGSGLAFAWYTQYAGTLSLAGSSPSMFSIDPQWEVVQLADWDGDGDPDLLFRNTSSGVVFVWYMAGTTLGASDFINQIDPSWEIVPRR